MPFGDCRIPAAGMDCPEHSGQGPGRVFPPGKTPNTESWALWHCGRTSALDRVTGLRGATGATFPEAPCRRHEHKALKTRYMSPDGLLLMDYRFIRMRRRLPERLLNRRLKLGTYLGIMFGGTLAVIIIGNTGHCDVYV